MRSPALTGPPRLTGSPSSSPSPTPRPRPRLTPRSSPSLMRPLRPTATPRPSPGARKPTSARLGERLRGGEHRRLGARRGGAVREAVSPAEIGFEAEIASNVAREAVSGPASAFEAESIRLRKGCREGNSIGYLAPYLRMITFAALSISGNSVLSFMPIVAYCVVPGPPKCGIQPLLRPRWGLGTYHGLRRKHVDTYLDEFVFRYNRRFYRHASFEKLLGLTARHAPSSYWDIVGRANPRKGEATTRRAPRHRKTAVGMRRDGAGGEKTDGQNHHATTGPPRNMD